MKSLSEKIEWYKESETRAWKRIWNFCELLIFSLSAIAIVSVVNIYGDGTKLQPVFTLFTVVLAISASCGTVALLYADPLKRWLIQIITFGFGGAVGISAVAALLILELQNVST